MKFKVFNYPLKDKKGNVYMGSYTIKYKAKPLGFPREKLCYVFDMKFGGNLKNEKK